MYHKFSKNDPKLRKAIWEVYGHRCAYCGDYIQPKNMHIDHILATNHRSFDTDELMNYYNELAKDGFELNSIENYFPTCPNCNLYKNNKNFSVSNLRFFHQKASENAPKILTNLNRYSDDISFPTCSVDYQDWTKIDFARQNGLSNAIKGYKLSCHDVCACPRLSKFDEIKSSVDNNNYAIIQGAPGTGKSITAFQVSYEYAKNGWTVYLFKHTQKNKLKDIFLGNISDDSIFIVDDAHWLTEDDIMRMVDSAHAHAKLLILLSIDQKAYNGSIIINAKDNIKIIYNHYRNKRAEVLDIVSKLDTQIGNKITDIPIESRLDEAEHKAITPWHFNYILRGGWHVIKDVFSNIETNPSAKLLAVIIATYQIINFDNEISTYSLKKECRYFNIHYDKTNIKCLINLHLIVSANSLRYHHIEGALMTVICYCKSVSYSEREKLILWIKKLVLNKVIPLRGLIVLYQGIMRYHDTEELAAGLITQEFVDAVFNDIDNTTLSKSDVVRFLSETWHHNLQRNGKYYFNQYFDIFSEWISDVNDESAYSFSLLINDLINDSENNKREHVIADDLHERFISRINMQSVMTNFSNASRHSLNSWAHFFDRLVQRNNHIDYGKFGNEILKCKSLFIKSPDKYEILVVREYIAMLSVIANANSDVNAINLFKYYSEHIKALFQQDFLFALHIFSFEFVAFALGLNQLEPKNYSPTKVQIEITKVLISFISDDAIVDTICLARENTCNYIKVIMFLLENNDHERFVALCKKIETCQPIDKTVQFFRH